MNHTHFSPWKGFSFAHGHYALNEKTMEIACLSKPYSTEHNEILSTDAYPAEKPVAVDINALALMVAQKCNLACSYCYGHAGTYGNESLMRFATAKKAIDLFSQGKKRLKISFFGGEPLLNFALIEKVVAYCQQNPEVSYSFGITTNGVALTKDHAEFFRKHQFSIKVSYDHGKKTERVFPNGKDSAPLIKKRIDAMSAELRALSGLVRLTLRKENPKQTESLMGVLEKFSSQGLRVKMAQVASPHKEVQLSSGDANAIGFALEELVDRLLAQDRFKDLCRLQNLRMHLKRFAQRTPPQVFCGAGVQFIAVNTSGRFFLCHRFTESEASCVGDVDAGLDLARLQRVREFRKGEGKSCKTCWMRYSCKGGCLHLNKVTEGEIDRIHPVFCFLQAIEIRLALKVYTHICDVCEQDINEYF